MATIFRQSAKRLEWLLELMISIYVPFLVVSYHEGPGGRWATRMLVFGISHGYLRDIGRSMEDYRVETIAFFLAWIPAVVVFLFLRLASRFSFTKILLLGLGGGVAIAGYPLACLYAGRGMFFLDAELVTAAVIAGIWACRRWPASAALGILLLAFHYGLWFVFAGATGGGEILLWPTWRRARWILQYSGLLYPLVGFCSALLWAGYVRPSGRLED